MSAVENDVDEDHGPGDTQTQPSPVICKYLNSIDHKGLEKACAAARVIAGLSVG